MKNNPEIIAARINFETAMLNAYVAGSRIEDENNIYHRDGLRCSPAQYGEMAAQSEKVVKDILTELEMPPGFGCGSLVTISRPGALAIFDEIVRARNSGLQFTDDFESALAELGQALGEEV